MAEKARSFLSDAQAKFDGWADATEVRLKEPQDPKALRAEVAAQKKLQCKQLAQKLDFLTPYQVAQRRQGLTLHMDKRITKMEKANKEAWDIKMAEKSQCIQGEARSKVNAWVVAAEEGYSEPRDPKELQTELAAKNKLHCKQLATDLKFMPHAHVKQACEQLSTHTDERLAKLIKMNTEAWDIKLAEMARQVQASAQAAFMAWWAVRAEQLQITPCDPNELQTELAAQTKSHCKQLAAKLDFMPRAHVELARGQLSTYIDQRTTMVVNTNKMAWDIMMARMAEEARQIQGHAYAEFQAWAAWAERGLRTEPRDPVGVASWLAEQNQFRRQQLAQQLTFLPGQRAAQYCEELGDYMAQHVAMMERANRDEWERRAQCVAMMERANQIERERWASYNAARHVAEAPRAIYTFQNAAPHGGGSFVEAPRAIPFQNAAPHGGGSSSSPSKASASGFKRDATGRWHNSKGRFASKVEVAAAGLSW